ncbi:hypothetical protein MTO96_009641 [Rhipicephalus appendiculatus]
MLLKVMTCEQKQEPVIRSVLANIGGASARFVFFGLDLISAGCPPYCNVVRRPILLNSQNSKEVLVLRALLCRPSRNHSRTSRNACLKISTNLLFLQIGLGQQRRLV